MPDALFDLPTTLTRLPGRGAASPRDDDQLAGLATTTARATTPRKTPGRGTPAGDVVSRTAVPATARIEPYLAHVAAFHLVAFGTPGPQGSKSYKGRSGRGRAIMVESSAKVKPWRLVVADRAEQILRCCDDPTCPGLRAGFPLDGPLVARVVFTLRKPTSAPKRTVTYPDRYPDLSKLLRATEDALTGLAWKDDARLVDYTRLAKVYPGEDEEALPAPGVVLMLWRRDGVPC